MQGHDHRLFSVTAALAQLSREFAVIEGALIAPA
jgi:hypothetical protein